MESISESIFYWFEFWLIFTFITVNRSCVVQPESRHSMIETHYLMHW